MAAAAGMLGIHKLTVSRTVTAQAEEVAEV
jgi:hypothetical protein